MKMKPDMNSLCVSLLNFRLKILSIINIVTFNTLSKKTASRSTLFLLLFSQIACYMLHFAFMFFSLPFIHKIQMFKSNFLRIKPKSMQFASFLSGSFFITFNTANSCFIPICWQSLFFQWFLMLAQHIFCFYQWISLSCMLCVRKCTK